MPQQSVKTVRKETKTQTCLIATNVVIGSALSVLKACANSVGNMFVSHVILLLAIVALKRFTTVVLILKKWLVKHTVKIAHEMSSKTIWTILTGGISGSNRS